MGGQHRIYRMCLLAKDGNLKAGLNFTTSNIKPAWGTASEKDSVQVSNKQQNGSPAKEDEKDDLPF